MNKKLALLISIFSIFVLINVFFPNNTQAYEDYTMVMDKIKWHYNLNDKNEAINVYAELNGTNADIEEITIPDKFGDSPVVSIGKYPYYEYNLFNRTRDEQIKKVIIPDTVREITRYTFINCLALESVEIPESVQIIGDKAFYNCGKLNSIGSNLPTAITEIGNNAFYNCSNLSIENIALPSNISTIGEYAFYNCKKITGSLTLPDSLTTLGAYAFNRCSGLNGTLTIGSGLKTIGKNTFENCSGLTGDLTIPSTITEVQGSAFKNCKGFNGTLNYESPYNTIESWTFSNCNFSKIKLPGTVTKIEAFSFNNIKDVWIDSNKESVETELFWGGIFNNAFLHYRDCKHNITITAPEGVQVVDKKTNQVITTGEYDCETAMNLGVSVDDIESYGYLNMVISTDSEILVKRVNLLENPEYTYEISSLNRDREIKITGQDIKSVELDLVAREYLDSINGVATDPSRVPTVQYTEGSIEYNHSKFPVEVKTGDLVTFKIRVYNEAENEAYAKEIKQMLPEGLEFAENNVNNLKYKWVLSEDKRTITTSYLENTAIQGCTGNDPKFAEIEFTCKVTAEKKLEEDTRLVVVGEITKGQSGEKELYEGNLEIENLAEYKAKDAYESNSSTYVRGTEKDDDFENVIISKDIAVDYTLRIEKIDDDKQEYLNGAKFELLDENKKVLQTGVTANDGILDFGMKTSYGTGDDVYYIKEIESPEGYRRVTQDEIRIVVHKVLEGEEYKIQVECDLFETKVLTETSSDVIPITTEDQLAKIGTNETEERDGKTYVYNKNADYALKNDITLKSENWKPIEGFSGVFDGEGHTISNLKIKQDGITEGEEENTNFGLFADAEGTIKNLNVTGVHIEINEITTEIDKEIEKVQEGIKSTPSNKELQEQLEELQKQREELVSKYKVGSIVGYMKQGTIQNCTASGEIFSDTNNAGGIVGYGQEGKLLIINGCTNNASIEITGSKAGGIIGVGYGALSVVDCVNNGSVDAEKYNAGGLVGYAEALDYEVNNVVVKLDDTKRIVTITVQNQKTTGEYSLRLKNVDIDTYELLDGAKFDILGQDKSKIKNVTAQNGEIEIEKVEIDKLGTDTYYIVQTETPKGYIDVTEYVKVTISKIWNGALERYEVVVNTEPIKKEQFDTEENIDDSHSSSKTNKKYEVQETKDVTWKVNKVYVKDSTNNGNINANKYNAGGIIGSTKCKAELENCTNKGKISSELHSSGMIAETEKAIITTPNGEEEPIITYEIVEIRMYGCINDGEITLNPNTSSSGSSYPGSSSSMQRDMAGFISYTTVPVVIDNCKNNKDIKSVVLDDEGREEDRNVSTISGFIAIANTDAEITIKNSANNGEISSKSAGESAGFVAKKIGNNSTITLENCENNANIIGGKQVSGFIALAMVDDISIKDCRMIGTEEKTLEISAYQQAEMGGLVALTGANLDINGCTVENVDFKVNGGSTPYVGGIVGQAYNNGLFYKTDLDKNIMINNISMRNIKLRKINKETAVSNVDFAGILEKCEYNYKIVEIENSTVDGLIIEDNIGLQYGAGILGFSYNVNNVNIANNIINDANICSLSSSGYSSHLAGVLGLIANATNGTINIENNQFTNGSIEAQNSTGLAGMVAEIVYSNGSKLNIVNCKVDNSILKNEQNTSKVGRNARLCCG